jgi:hypothetical protein
MINLRKYEQLKSQVDQARQEADRAGGALAQIMTRLEEDFGCDSLKKAERLEAELKGKAKKAEEEFNVALAEFEEKWELESKGE